MTDSVLIALIGGSFTTLTASVSAVFAYKAKQTSKETHLLFNSRMTELMELSKLSAFDKGIAYEKQRELSERDNRDKS